MSENHRDSNEKKEDARVRFTKLQIRNALLSLLKEQSIDKITVTAICKEAEINRATFYKHYLDVYDLSEKLQEEAILSFSNELDTLDANNVKNFIINILHFFKSTDNKLLIKTNSDNGALFSENISKLIYANFSNLLDDVAKVRPDINKAALFSYIISGSKGIIDYWIGNDFRDTEEDIANQIIEFSGILTNTLRESRKI